jgi:hypothetical protein
VLHVHLLWLSYPGPWAHSLTHHVPMPSPATADLARDWAWGHTRRAVEACAACLRHSARQLRSGPHRAATNKHRGILREDPWANQVLPRVTVRWTLLPPPRSPWLRH